MSNIPYPDIPQYPGVPALPRNGNALPVGVDIALGTLGNILLNALQTQTKWGIYDQSGNQLGGVDALSLVNSLLSQSVVLSTVNFEPDRSLYMGSWTYERMLRGNGGRGGDGYDYCTYF